MIKVSHGGQTAVKVDTLTPQTVVIASKANTFLDSTGKLFTAAACSKIAEGFICLNFHALPLPLFATVVVGTFELQGFFCKM